MCTILKVSSYLQDDTNDNLRAVAFQNDVCNVESGMIARSFFFIFLLPTNMKVNDHKIKKDSGQLSSSRDWVRSKTDEASRQELEGPERMKLWQARLDTRQWESTKRTSIEDRLG